MDYNIENMDSTNAYYYAKVSALAWKESYKGIVDVIESKIKKIKKYLE